MKKLKTVLKQPEFHAFLFVLCLIFFTYPLVLMSNKAAANVIYSILFLAWIIVITLLFVITRSYTESQPDPGQEDEDVTHV